MKNIKSYSDTVVYFSKRFLMWLLVAGIVGAIGGVIGTAFHMAVHYATELRAEYPYILYLLPVAGMLIAGIYRLTKMEGVGTNNIITSVQFGSKVPPILLPVIFISTTLTHLCGGSAGREGAALQIGGSIGSMVGRVINLDEQDTKLITMSGMSAVFSALFGTPLAATVFAMEVASVGIVQYSALIPCLVSAVTAFEVAVMMGVEPTRYAVAAEALSPAMLCKVAVLAVICAVVSIVFCLAIHKSSELAEKKIHNPYLRGFIGGVAVIALTLLLGTTDYNGAGGGIIAAAIEQGQANGFAFFWKLLFTAITIGFGFKGGEIVPTFFVGATLGCVVGPVLGIPAGFAAAVALTAVFCGNVNCPIASILLAIELFGGAQPVYFALACAISYMLSGYVSLYHTQKIVFSKLRPEALSE